MLSSLIADLAIVYFMIQTTTLRGDKGRLRANPGALESSGLWPAVKQEAQS